MVELDRPGQPGDARGGLVFGRLKEAGLAALEGNLHLVAPSDGGFQRLGFAAPQLVGEIAAALFPSPDYADLITKLVGFGDVLDFGHTAISNGVQLADPYLTVTYDCFTVKIIFELLTFNATGCATDMEMIANPLRP